MRIRQWRRRVSWVVPLCAIVWCVTVAPERAGAAHQIAAHTGAPFVTTLAPSACPMAHCDPQMSDDEQVTIPTTTATIAWTFTAPISVSPGASLGCTVGTVTARCVAGNPQHSAAYDRPYAFAFDPATGASPANSGLAVNGSVDYGAPLIDAVGNTYASDDNYLVSIGANAQPRWRAPNPAGSAMLSWNLTSDGYLVGQGFRGPVLVVDPNTGTVTGQLPLSDTVNGVAGSYVTINTLSVVGNRLYTVTQFCPTQVCSTSTIPITYTLGRLYAIDVVHGVPQEAWHWDFAGPSGASPLTIPGPGPGPAGNTVYFDGAGLRQGDPHHPWLFALQDTGTMTPTLLWADDLKAKFGSPYIRGILASPARDPRPNSGPSLWAYDAGDPRLFRLDAATGALSQTISLTSTLAPGYVPASAMSIAVNGGHPVMILGSQHLWTQDTTYIIALDLLSGTLLWSLPVGFGTYGVDQGFHGQFPIAVTPAGPVIVASRADGTFMGIALH